MRMYTMVLKPLSSSNLLHKEAYMALFVKKPVDLHTHTLLSFNPLSMTEVPWDINKYVIHVVK